MLVQLRLIDHQREWGHEGTKLQFSRGTFPTYLNVYVLVYPILLTTLSYTHIWHTPILKALLWKAQFSLTVIVSNNLQPTSSAQSHLKFAHQLNIPLETEDFQGEKWHGREGNRNKGYVMCLYWRPDNGTELFLNLNSFMRKKKKVC